MGRMVSWLWHNRFLIRVFENWVFYLSVSLFPGLLHLTDVLFINIAVFPYFFKHLIKVIKIFVSEALSSSYSVLWVILKHPCDEINDAVLRLCHQPLHTAPLDRGKLRFNWVVFSLVTESFDDVRGRGPNYVVDSAYLVEFILPRKYWV